MSRLILALSVVFATGCGALGGRATASPAAPLPWQERYDFTGDGTPDRVELSFTGGSSCCYLLALRDGATGRRTALPFELDGGYVGGLDLSRPEQLAVGTEPSGRAYLVLRVATYGGEPEALPRDGWSLGVTSHRIEVRFPGGDARPQVRNLGWRCAEAMAALRRERWEAWEGMPADCALAEVLEALDAVAGAGRAELGPAGETHLIRTAVRAADDTRLELTLAPAAARPGPAARPSSSARPGSALQPRAAVALDDLTLVVTRLDWLDAARARAAAAAWQHVPASVDGEQRRWPCGLAIAPATDAPERLILLPRLAQQ